MKKLTKLLKSSLLLSAVSLLAACSVDDKYDVSKDIDMTVGVGGGVSLPIGSTEKIMITELIDTADTDVLEIDAAGDYAIRKSGTFDAVDFEIKDVDINVDFDAETAHYDFNLYNLSENVDDLPSWIQEEIKKQRFPYIVQNDVDYTTSFDITQEVPEEMKKLRKMTFKNDVNLEVDLKIFSADHQSDDLLQLTNALHLKADGEKGFVIEVPDYIVFAEEEGIKDGKLVLAGAAVYDKNTNAIEYRKSFKIVGLDFSHLADGALAVNDGKINIHHAFNAWGYVVSDTVFFGYDNITHIQSVDVACEINLGTMSIESVEGVFSPEIDPITEVVDLELGEDLDFLNEAYLDFNNPRIYINNFNNPVAAAILADASFVGLDDNGAVIAGSKVGASIKLAPSKVSNIVIDRYGYAPAGYTNIMVPSLNNLIKRIPETVDVKVDARMDETLFSSVTLGETLTIAGDYEVSVPLAFDSLKLEYVEEVEDVLGEDASDITDYVTDIKSVTLTFDVYNTIPAEFNPSIVAYDENGTLLGKIKAVVTGVIAKGNGTVAGVVGEPVKSEVKVVLSALDGQLEDLYKLDIKFAGTGSGVFNANEYIQLKDMKITIDENVNVDLN